MPHLYLALRIVLALSGAFLICVRLFLYEEEHGKLQSKVEDWWNGLFGFYPKAMARHLALLRGIAQAISKALDNIFGSRLWSLESVVVCACLSASYILLFAGFYKRVFEGEWEPERFLGAIPYACFGLAPFFYRTFTKRRRANKGFMRDARRLWVVGVLVFFCWWSAWSHLEFWYESDYPVFAALLLAIMYFASVLGIGAHYISILLIRKTYRSVANAESFGKVLFQFLINLLPGIAVLSLVSLFWFGLDYWPFTEPLPKLSGPEEAAAELFRNATFRFQVVLALPIGFLIMFELVFILSSLLSFMLAAFLIAHRLAWPLVLRLLYASKKNEIVRQGRVLVILGVALIILGIGKYEWIIHLFK